MFSRSLPLVLLVLSCLPTFTSPKNGRGPEKCCFSYQRSKIPLRLITGYDLTDHQCRNHGVVFTLKTGHELCADPEVSWVKSHMTKLDQRLIDTSTRKQTS